MAERITVKTGIPGDEQESEMMNRTQQMFGDGSQYSMAIETMLTVPAEIIELGEHGIAGWIETTLARATAVVPEIAFEVALGLNYPRDHDANYRTLYVVVTGTASDEEDEAEDIPGRYEIAVQSHLSREEQAMAALDCFHETVPVACLDDFEFAVVDEFNEDLDEGDNPEGYKHGDYARFVGKVPT